MDEELINLAAEEVIEVDLEEVVESDVELEDLEETISTEETIEFVEVEPAEEINIEMDEAVGWVGGDSTRHYSLYGREEPNQHPIEAITGLRNELDAIEALQVVYSDEKNQANYYLWQDENLVQENRVGYFVAIGVDTNQVKLCTESDDIFGVTVSTAAFIGGQSDLARDYKYALVAHSGMVAVRCESDVVVGDTVVTNDYGYAKKSNSGYGYKVIELQNIDGVIFAIICLNISANQVDTLMQEVDLLDERMDRAEINITAAVNVANEAYDKATEINAVSEEAIKKALEALEKSNAATDDVDEMEKLVASSNQAAIEAKTIAESAVTSAEAMKNEAITKANEALAEAQNTKKEVENKIEEINAEVDSTLEELYRTQTELTTTRDDLSTDIQNIQEELTVTRDELSTDIQSTKDSIASMEEDLVPLTTWPDAENPTGIAGFVAQADENTVTLGSLVKWQGETNTAIAGFKQEVADTYATIESVAALDTKTTNAIAGVKQEAAETYATIEDMASFKTETSEAITGVKQEVSDTYATIDSVASLKTELSDSISSVKQEATETYATISSVASLKTELSDSISSVEQEATEKYATIESVTSLKTEMSDSITKVQQEATETYATIDSMASLKTELSDSISSVKQKADANESSINSLTTWKNSAVTSIANVEQKADANESSIKSLTAWQGEAKKAIANVEQKADDNESKISSLTTWQGNTNTAIANIEQKADANGASLQFLTANIDKYSVGEYSQAYGLTLEQAKSTLEEGMIYVPTVNHSEEYDDTLTTNFTQGYYYTWDGSKWVESSSPAVKFSNSYVVGGTSAPYWYIPGSTDVTYDGTTYESESLYLWQENKWVSVATLSGNLASRKMTLLRQTDESFSLGISNLQGSFAGLDTRLTKTEADVKIVADWKSDVESDVSKIATIEAKANDASASVAMVVTEKDGEKVINAASVVTAINDSGSSVTLEGDHIILNGATTNGNGTFSVSTDGHMTASGGSIGGFTIGTKSIYNTKTSYNSSTAGVYLGTDGIGLGAGKFYVTSAGALTSTSGSIGGWTIGSTTIKGKTVGSNYTITLNSDPSADAAIWAGAASSASAPFCLSHNGKLRATGVDVTGTINAEGGSIGGWKISGTQLVSSQGTNGDLFYMNGNPGSSGQWMFLVDSNSKIPFCIDYDGTTHIANLKLGWNDTMIVPSGNNGVLLRVNNTSGNIICASSWTTAGIQMYKGNNNISIGIQTNYGVYLNSDSGRLSGTWYGTSGSAITSDKNKKNTISPITEKYDTFFDNLIGSTFKYNDGTSDRLHTGFIAQEVKEALDFASLDAQEFGGLVVKKNSDETEDWYLRYEEFVALNTWQIQKAKQRIAELEDRVAQLEKLINEG